MAQQVNMDCKKCLRQTLHWDNRENKPNPKAPDYKCATCGEGIWLPKPRQPKPPYQPLTTPKELVRNGMPKPKDDCTISALAIIKSLIESHFYNYALPQEEVIERIWDHIVLFRERFRNGN